MQHNLNSLKFHVWETANKVNLYTSKEVNEGDTLVQSGTSVTVTKVCDKRHPGSENPMETGVMFYELNVDRD